jgi:glycosyltransferase involved in cell wall biosynthesis
VIVNGGNCRWGDVSWVHYVHAAYQPETHTTTMRRAKARFVRQRSLRSERQTLGTVRLAICNSGRTQRDLVNLLGIPEARTRVVYYGTDANRFTCVEADAAVAARAALGLPSDGVRVLFIGALGDRRKGFDTLVDAWSTLCREASWDGHLVVVGAGAEVQAWQRRMEEAGLGARATFLGFRTDVERVIASCDVMVHAARYEAYGLGVHEALCCGVPAVVTEAAGVAERYPTTLEDLLLRDPNSADELATRLRGWRARRDAIRREMRMFSDTLRARSWSDMAADIVGAVRGCG